MSELMTFDEILDFAIEAEQAAADLYAALASSAKNKAIGKMFSDFSDEEKGHKKKLLDVKAGKRFLTSGDKPVVDLKIADYVVDEEPDADADYQSVLIFAMQKEKAAFRLYSDLAAKTDVPELAELLLLLAQEEAKHKLRFELEYDENVLTEN